MSLLMGIAFLLAGCIVGTLSGMIGIGGGVFVIPLLMYVFHFSYKQAVGTSLGMLLPPIGLLAFLTYFRNQQVNVAVAGLMAMGFAAGALLGGILVTRGWVAEAALRRLFAILLLLIAGDMLFRGDRQAWAALRAIGPLIFASGLYLILKIKAREWESSLTPGERYLRLLEQNNMPEYEI